MEQDRESMQKDSYAHAHPLPTPPPQAGEGADRVRRSHGGMIRICICITTLLQGRSDESEFAA
jgi:hypothetical protein